MKTKNKGQKAGPDNMGDASNHMESFAEEDVILEISVISGHGTIIDSNSTGCGLGICKALDTGQKGLWFRNFKDRVCWLLSEVEAGVALQFLVVAWFVFLLDFAGVVVAKSSVVAASHSDAAAVPIDYVASFHPGVVVGCPTVAAAVCLVDVDIGDPLFAAARPAGAAAFSSAPSVSSAAASSFSFAAVACPAGAIVGVLSNTVASPTDAVASNSAGIVASSPLVDAAPSVLGAAVPNFSSVAAPSFSGRKWAAY
ncbi:hypothetical protein ACOSP7_022890 [Xanthoceras sorbifolium]